MSTPMELLRFQDSCQYIFNLSCDHALNAECSTDEGLKSAACLSDVLLSPKSALSQEPEGAPFNVAFDTDVWYYSWYDIEGHEYRQTRFNQAMNGSKSAVGADAILEGMHCIVEISTTSASFIILLAASDFDWKGLKEGAIIVDVGGGVGSQSMALAQHFSHLHFVLEDRQSVLNDAILVRYLL
jgi:hypothetical protein